MSELSVQVLELLKKVDLAEFYRDLAQPGVQQVGQAIGTLLGLGNTCLLPIWLINERSKLIMQKNLEKFRAKLEGTDLENIRPVTPEIGVPILQRFAFTEDADLSDLFSNLLAKAAIGNQTYLAHPAFVNIIGNLSPDEAKLIRHLKDNATIPYLKARLDRIQLNPEGSMKVFDRLTALQAIVPLAFPENMSAYLSNMESLGLIYFADREIVTSDDDEQYSALRDHYRSHLKACGEIPDECALRFFQHAMHTTEFGDLFIKACV